MAAPHPAETVPLISIGSSRQWPEPVLCRALYRTFASGVSLVTARDLDGPVGMTASSVVAVSLEPALLLVCLANESHTLAAVHRSGRFAVNQLDADQEGLAVRFAQSRPSWAKYHGVGLLGDDPPVLAAALSAAVCKVDRIVPAGDHTVVIGAVESAAVGSGHPLLWFGSEFCVLAASAAEDAVGTAPDAS